MYHPTEVIQDIQTKLDRMVRNYRTLLETIKKLETENKVLATSLEEAVKQQETLKHKLDAITQESLRDTKGLDQWKHETRREIRGIMKEMEKCLPQVESLLDK
jgi:predicted RNase H-like nuclease (RuvC/YqgF family)